MSRRSEDMLKKSSSSREEDDRKSKRRHSNRSCKDDKKKSSEGSHKRRSRSPNRGETKPSAVCKDSSQPYRHIKNAVYSLKQPGQNVFDKKNCNPKTKHSSPQIHKESGSSREKNRHSRKDNPVVESKNAEKKSSITTDIKSKNKVTKEIKEIAKDRKHSKSFQKSSSISKNERGRASSDCSKRDKEGVQKKKRRYEVPSSAGAHSSTVRTKENVSSPINDGSLDKSKDLLKNKSQMKEVKNARLSVITEPFSSSPKSTNAVTGSNEAKCLVLSSTTTSKEQENKKCQIKEVNESQQSLTTESLSSSFKPTCTEKGSNALKIATLPVSKLKIISKEAQKSKCQVKEVKELQQSLNTESLSSSFKPTCTERGSNALKIATLPVSKLKIISKEAQKSKCQAKEVKELQESLNTESLSSSFKPTFRERSSNASKIATLPAPKLKIMSKEPENTKFQVKEVKESQVSSTTESLSSSFKPTFTGSGSKEATLPVASALIKLSQADQPSPTQKKMIPIIIGPHISFKIGKKLGLKTGIIPGKNKDGNSTKKGLKPDIKPSDSETVDCKFKQQKTDKQADSCLEGIPCFKTEVVSPALFYNQVQVVEELHLARSEKRLEVNLMESYGELTCMDIDSAEELPSNTQSTKTAQQHLIIVLDTNILLSHLDYVKRITSRGLPCLDVPVVLIPWVVLQELDSLKKGRGLTGSVAHLAIPAISYIYNSIMKKDPHLWGQSMQQASESSYGLKTENNDDRVLQCCLQYQSIYPECVLILCTNDRNLCCKAILSGVKASTKNDLEAEIVTCRPDIHSRYLQPLFPRAQVSSPILRQNHNETRLFVGPEDKDINRLHKEREESTQCNLNRCVFELEECLHKVLSDVLEVEMKAVYEEIWLEIVLIKPPWTLLDVLNCFKKHWIAVFGQIVPRHLLQTITNLIDFFQPGKSIDRTRTSDILREVKEFLSFLHRSSHVPLAVSMIENIYNQLQPQSSINKTSAEDVVMNDADEEDQQHLLAQVSNQDVWSIIESIWSHIFNTSLEVFHALGFDPRTKQSTHPVGSQTPPQDAFACLHKLSTAVSQLLQAFSSFLSLAPDMKEIEALLRIIYSIMIADEKSRVTAKDLLECLSQPDYREKLRCGVSQLMELHEALDYCIQVRVVT